MGDRIKLISRGQLHDINSGIYILELVASVNFRIDIKRFSSHDLFAGYYYYAGSAQKNLPHRILRHFRKQKKVHWHIDHLTTHSNIALASALILPNAGKSIEWQIAEDLENHFKCGIPLIGFGNSDTNKTKSHLFHNETRIPYSHFISRYQSMVRFIPSSSETS